jgi:hypothetical protein
LALPDKRWNLDLVHDQMAYDRRCRVINVVDGATKECLAAVPHTRFRGTAWCAIWPS